MRKVIFDLEWVNFIQAFNDKQSREFLMAFAKQVDPEEVTDPIVKGIYAYVKTKVDENLSKYKDKTETNKQNGMKGGRPKKTQNNPNNPTVIEENRSVISKNPNNHNTIQYNNNTNQYNSIQDRSPNSDLEEIVSKFFKLPPDVIDKWKRDVKKWLETKGNYTPTEEEVGRLCIEFYKRNPDKHKPEPVPLYRRPV